jgi:methyl-accepting chemotaxis protein
MSNEIHKSDERVLIEIISRLERLLEVLPHLATKHDLYHIHQTIMSAISDFAARQAAFNDRIDQAVTGLQGDVKTLQDTIDKLQNTAGQITPEDQALLDQIDARADAVATKLEALDALTPPAPPVG